MTAPHATRPDGPSGAVLRQIYDRMRASQGHQGWWPGRNAFEVCVSAILVQNTAWTNVERAMANLDAAGALTVPALARIPDERLGELIRPAGSFRVKARRLRAFLRTLIEEHQGQLDDLFAGTTTQVRDRLLAIHGIGPETADSMLLYAGGHLRFVVDAYTRRIFHRHGWCVERETYAGLQEIAERSAGTAAPLTPLDYWQDFHAQLVAVGKDYCRSREARCGACPLRPLLPASGPVGIPLANDRAKKKSAGKNPGAP